MNEGDRIRQLSCGCRYDVVMGVATAYCPEHDILPSRRPARDSNHGGAKADHAGEAPTGLIVTLPSVVAAKGPQVAPHPINTQMEGVNMDDHQQSGSNSDAIAKVVAEAEQIAQQTGQLNRMVALTKQMAQHVLSDPSLPEQHRMAIQGQLDFLTWRGTNAGAAAADYIGRPENTAVIADTADSIVRFMGLSPVVLAVMMPLAEYLAQIGYWMRDQQDQGQRDQLGRR